MAAITDCENIKKILASNRFLLPNVHHRAKFNSN